MQVYFVSGWRLKGDTSPGKIRYGSTGFYRKSDRSTAKETFLKDNAS
ncbi:hypothetical protein [Dyadobacter helix]|nr:hypothetical protein [Dyadobacter sp. CECT 9275]